MRGLRARALLERERDTLVLHALGRDFLTAEGKAHISGVGNMGPKGFSDPNLLFIRDYFPMQVSRQSESGKRQLSVVKYLSYRNIGLTGEATHDPSTFIPVSPPKDAPAGARAYQFGGKTVWMKSETMPLFFEGGNIAATSKLVITSEKVVNENARSIADVEAYLTRERVPAEKRTPFVRSLRENGYRARSREEVAKVLGESLGVSEKNVLFMPWMPGEKTGHVDLYIAPLNDKTMAVPYVPPKVIARLGYGHEREFATRLNGWLDHRVAELQKRGLAVERVPMLPPKNLRQSAVSEFGWDADYLSSVNWAVQGRKVIVPSYDRYMNELPEPEREAFRKEIEATLGKHGYKAEFKNADGLVGTNGGFHCITANIAVPD